MLQRKQIGILTPELMDVRIKFFLLKLTFQLLVVEIQTFLPLYSAYRFDELQLSSLLPRLPLR